jgi:cytochrome c-type biogenesis protein CcmF
MQVDEILIMINIGNISLYILALSCIAGSIVGLREGKKTYIYSVFQFGLSTFALLKLINIHINTDYRFLNVLENSHEIIPVLYKITGIWANHEGSMLLLLWSFSLVTFIFSFLSKFEEKITVRILTIQSIVLLLILSIILITSNPFQESETLLPAGRGFNPLLQDVGLAIHPPILYFGYAGLSLPFSIIIASLIQTPIPLSKDYLSYSYVWIFVPWAFLCAGIGLGSWWAYRELGWGGFWFWDPVENIPLLVWFASTISLHSFHIGRNTNNYTTFVAANILTFILSIFGMFLVRSGVLNSVHSFAFAPERGKIIFLIFCAIAIPSIALFIKRYPLLKKTNKLNFRILAILSNNVLLTIACFIILLGILYPVFQSLFFNKEVSVAESFYKNTLSFIFIPMLYIAGLYSSKTAKRILINLLLGSTALLCICLLSYIESITALLHIHSAIFLIVSLINTAIPKKNYTMFLGHLGFALVIIGASLYYSYHTDDVTALQEGESHNISGTSITLTKITYAKQDNYLSRTATLDVKRNGLSIGVAKPEIRFYPIEQTFTIESAVLHSLTGDLYVTLGELDHNKIVVEIQFKPFIYLIWLGVFITSSSFILYIVKKHAPTQISSKIKLLSSRHRKTR